MSAQHTAWCAGLFEGEGWLYLRRTQPKDRPAPRIEISAGITNTELCLLEVFEARYGGRIRPRKGTALSRKPLYEWRVEGPRCERFLLDIRPLLIGKQGAKADELLRVRVETIRRVA